MPLPLSELSSLLSAIHSHFRRIPGLRKVSARKRATFAVDLILICLSIRTGHLVDAFSIHNACEALTALLKFLQEVLPMFNSVSIIHEPSSDQVFIVNTWLLSIRIARCLGHPTDTENSISVDYVSVSDMAGTNECIDIPHDVRSCLEYIATNLELDLDPSTPSRPACLRLPGSPPSTMIPLAAIILEYPVAYVPSPSGQDTPATGFLKGVTLDVYECLIGVTRTQDDSDVLPEFRNHTLLKFSCPQGLARSLTTDIKSSLENHFGTRVRTLLEGIGIEVKHMSQTLDRVAL